MYIDLFLEDIQYAEEKKGNKIAVLSEFQNIYKPYVGRCFEN